MTDAREHPETIEAAVTRVDALLGPDVEPVLEETVEAAGDWGRYEGTPPSITLLPDGRKATLDRAIAFYQADETHWPVPVGAELDGASIPRVFWTLIGGPFEGKYRDASIVHDHYCVTQDRPWADVHRMFYDGMRCSGVGKRKAGVMYYAVYRFGPRWPDPSGESVESAPAEEQSPTDADADAFLEDARTIADRDLGPEAVAKLARTRERQEQAQAGDTQ